MLELGLPCSFSDFCRFPKMESIATVPLSENWNLSGAFLDIFPCFSATESSACNDDFYIINDHLQTHISSSSVSTPHQLDLGLIIDKCKLWASWMIISSDNTNEMMCDDRTNEPFSFTNNERPSKALAWHRYLQATMR